MDDDLLDLILQFLKIFVDFFINLLPLGSSVT